jgi:hypothetical protein
LDMRQHKEFLRFPTGKCSRYVSFHRNPRAALMRPSVHEAGFVN